MRQILSNVYSPKLVPQLGSKKEIASAIFKLQKTGIALCKSPAEGPQCDHFHFLFMSHNFYVT